MSKLNSCQEESLFKELIMVIIQIKEGAISLINKREKGIYIRSILNYEIFQIC